jgi:hypothetical protein
MLARTVSWPQPSRAEFFCGNWFHILFGTTCDFDLSGRVNDSRLPYRDQLVHFGRFALKRVTVFCFVFVRSFLALKEQNELPICSNVLKPGYVGTLAIGETRWRLRLGEVTALVMSLRSLTKSLNH